MAAALILVISLGRTRGVAVLATRMRVLCGKDHVVSVVRVKKSKNKRIARRPRVAVDPLVFYSGTMQPASLRADVLKQRK